MPSEQIENYLKNIYKIQELEGRVTTSSLSARLNISAASVTEMVKKLAEERLIAHKPYKGVGLTAAGRREALRVVRRHRLWELFLVEVLKFEWEEIDAEAERLEHLMSDRLEQRIDEILGHPKRDPHGDVIPTAEGIIESVDQPALSAIEPGRAVVVGRVSDADPAVLRYARKLGIALGRKVRIKERMAFDGSLRINVAGREHFISQKLAENIFVEE